MNGTGQANLPVTAGEFARTGAILAMATAALGYILLRTANRGVGLRPTGIRHD